MHSDHDDYDSPWKEAIERYLPEFMAFFFPAAHAAIDWSQGYVCLDKELRAVARDAELGRRLVDMLVQVTLTDGAETDSKISDMSVEQQNAEIVRLLERFKAMGLFPTERQHKVTGQIIDLDDYEYVKPDRSNTDLIGGGE